ncbi:GIY-YIG nuclease family protein [Patescibacteria group bacterium]|nr:GIY-YIG nuclease family protein [Patescibacteria group bacterium]MCL5797765.1 GIY-YIG nuclease family protein [Patescibacteria group bacterium]
MNKNNTGNAQTSPPHIKELSYITVKAVSFIPKNINKLPEIPGVYRYLDTNGGIIYIGKAINLKRRVSSYFQKQTKDAKTENLVRNIHKIEIIPVRYEFEALLLEANLIRIYKPKYNVIWKDDKHYIYIQITMEEFPRLILTRRKEDGRSFFSGPFPSSRIAREILANIRRIIPYCTQSPNRKRSCFYTYLGLCNPCPAVIKKLEQKEYARQKKIYLRNISRIKNLLSGDFEPLSRYLLAKMQHLSSENKFEEAATYRDKLKHLNYLLNINITNEYMADPRYISHVFKLEKDELLWILKEHYPSLTRIERIECYDISNTSGTFATGSMISFKHNLPDKSYYRRFRIRIHNKIDDFGMLKEMLERRLKHREWKLPDLMVVDGGKPQLRIFNKVLANFTLNVPAIGLAKQNEEIVVCANGNYFKVILPRRSNALHLVQRVRDEAHRFAHKYHELLRLKNMVSNE